MISLAASSDDSDAEKYYLRAISEDNPRQRPVQLETDFPTIAEDFQLPDRFLEREKVFSSVLRVSSGGIRVWTHYDVMDNIYCQVIGHKRAVLWPPDQVDNIYLTGDKSRVIDIDNPDMSKYPRYVDIIHVHMSVNWLATASEGFLKLRDTRWSLSLATSSSFLPSGSTTCWLTTSGWRSMSSGGNWIQNFMTTKIRMETGIQDI